ncbi:TonB-dependent receptor [Pedobacter cryoconitis]|uniref:Outer membrane cobalamin receptor n=1 Tax=Pedobacter cryoconitis TaxID=188932 RepID=A0A7X0J060_9SPHI|nr:TonB-dependent receptor [Pedobacter cryoconitis]MBB6498670.1 outer membrane cobalamin receptor [Pedobacter cryoconitis]
MRPALLSFFFLLNLKNFSAFAQQKNNSGTLNGRITDQSTGETLIGVSITAINSKNSTTTNNYGYFSITVPADTATFRISYIGYRTIDTLINLSVGHTVSLQLKPVRNELNTVVIKGTGSQPVQNTSQMGKINLPISQIQSLPKFFGEPDLLKALQTLPGVQQGSEGTSAILVRGGSPDQNLILLDGAPLYNPSHLLGIFSAFNTYAIKNVDLYKGAFPARYGGRLSSVVDIAMNDGNMKKVHGQLTVGLLASQFTLEGPLKTDKTSFIISGRRTYHDLFIAPLIKSNSPEVEKFTLYFYDLNAKIHHQFSDKDHLYLSFYNGKDKLRIKQADKADDGTGNSSDFGLGWSNTTGAVRWNHIFSGKLFANTTLTTSQYKFDTNISSSVFGSKINADDILNIKSGITDYTAKIDFDYQPAPVHNIKTGASYTIHTFTPGTSLSKQSFNNNILKDDNFGSRIQGKEMDLYAEDDWSITDKLKINIGIHASGFDVQNRFYASLQPRLSARYLLPGDWALKASYAKMTQYMHLLASNSISLPTDLWVPATSKVLPQQSNQVALGLSRNVFNDKFEFSAEVYYKTMDHIIEYKDGADYVTTSQNNDWENKITSGKGKAYGLELFLQKKTGRLTGWASYALARTDRSLPEINGGKTFPYKYDRRHTLNLVGIYKLKPGIELSGTFVFQSASPFTMPTTQFESVSPGQENHGKNSGGRLDYIESRNNIRIEPTHRLDLGVSFIKQKKSGTLRTWSFSIYNVYNKQNLFYFTVKDYKGNTAILKGNSLLPFMPGISYSLKF